MMKAEGNTHKMKEVLPIFSSTPFLANKEYTAERDAAKQAYLGQGEKRFTLQFLCDLNLL